MRHSSHFCGETTGDLLAKRKHFERDFLVLFTYALNAINAIWRLTLRHMLTQSLGLMFLRKNAFVLDNILKASKNATVTTLSYPRLNALYALLSDKGVSLWLRYHGNIFLVLIKQTSYGDLYLLIKGHNPNFVSTKAKSSYQSGYKIFRLHGPSGLTLSENVQCCLHSVYSQPGLDVLKL